MAGPTRHVSFGVMMDGSGERFWAGKLVPEAGGSMISAHLGDLMQKSAANTYSMPASASKSSIKIFDEDHP
jgi:hypothetical protein